jgi:arachidonate 5-lipoxygenase
MGLKKASGFTLLITAVILLEAVGAFVVPSRAFASFHAKTAPFSTRFKDHFLVLPLVSPSRRLLPTTHATVKDSLDQSEEIAEKQKLVASTLEYLVVINDADTLGDLTKAAGLDVSLLPKKLVSGKIKKIPAISKLIYLLKMIKNRAGPATMEYTKYGNHPEFPDYDLSTMMRMMTGPPPLDYFFSPKKINRVIVRIIQDKIAQHLREDEIKAAKTMEDKLKTMFTESKIAKVFNNPLDFHPRPTYCINHWEEDTYVAKQFLCGTNPVMIKAAKSMGEISKELVNHFGPKYLQDLIDEKRLLYVSYDDLAELTTNPHQAQPLAVNPNATQNQPRYFYAPIALFALDEARQELDILGIQLERKSNARVYTKNTSEKNEWMFVKSCLTTADSQMHEWVSHLGGTHLTMEPHIIAIHNTLKKKKHPIYTFVKPLCQDTLFLNWGARFTLAEVGPDSFGDRVTSTGVGQFLQLIEKMWSRYDFFESSSLPLELASRGFDNDFDIPAYLFREDGMKLWNAYGNFAADFVSEVYPSDAEVASDKILQEWAIETSSPDRAAVPGFPKSFQDKATLCKVLQTLMWMTSGLHAAVNFPQYEFMTYGPNRPLGQRSNLLKSDQPITREWIFDNSFPTIEVAQEILTTVYTITLPSDHCIDNLHEKHFSEVGEKAYKKFQKTLDTIKDLNDKRNSDAKNANKFVYNFLNPSVVPASIDI